MADDKKKEKPAGWNLTPFEAIILFIFLGALSTSIIPSVWNYFRSGEISFYGIPLSGLLDFLRDQAWLGKSVAFVAAGGAAIATFIFNKKGNLIWREEVAKLYPANMPEVVGTDIPQTNPLLSRWQKIVEKLDSTNPSEWRLAIIEADIMLAELLETLQLPGETIGDKLKAVEPSDFLSLDLAWEAHKARNLIAHEGEKYLLNEREARRLISLYETVFREFNLI